jgi:hypothetical protein
LVGTIGKARSEPRAAVSGAAHLDPFAATTRAHARPHRSVSAAGDERLTGDLWVEIAYLSGRLASVEGIPTEAPDADISARSAAEEIVAGTTVEGVIARSS